MYTLQQMIWSESMVSNEALVHKNIQLRLWLTSIVHCFIQAKHNFPFFWLYVLECLQITLLFNCKKNATYIFKSSVTYEPHEWKLLFILTWCEELGGKINLHDPPHCCTCFWKEEAVSILEPGMSILSFIAGEDGLKGVGNRKRGF